MGNSLANTVDTEIIMINLRICIWFFISVILFLIALYVGRKPNTKKKNKEYKGLISPILAEVLVDGKIDIKNLILTTIVELQIKKNIAIVNDNVIELLHKNNLNLHELYLADMIFLDKKNVTFNEINDRFIYARSYEANFIDSMSKISEEIQTKLYKLKIFSRKRMVILNVSSYFAMLILINLPSILLKAGFNKYFLYAFFLGTISIIASLFFFSRLFGKNDIADSLKNEFGVLKKNSGILALVCSTSIFVFFMLFSIHFNLASMLGILVVYCINLITLRMAKNNVLSDTGLEERRKILELKNFLEDYDLRKTEGQETYIIWDEYFAYSAAFGISNPVISDIFRKWNKLDITLFFTENLI